jgi:D-alanine transaminase/branched-chain amino acid aminotransferase
MQWFIVNGEVVSANEARLHVSDLCLLRGYGLFDFFLVKRGLPLFVEDHLSRFFHSASRLGIAPPLTREALAAEVKRLIALNTIAEGAIKLLLTGGYAEDGFSPGTPNLVLLAQSYQSPSPEQYQAGVNLLPFRYTRDLPDVKTVNYAQVLALQPALKAAGAADVLWHDGEVISESSRSNVFVLIDGVLRTPARNVLAGVTRKQVLGLAREFTSVEESDVSLASLATAHEMFMTSSSKGVLAVTRLDGKPVGDGRPGALTRELAKRLEAHIAAYLEAAARR